jgi:divalent metal cation (Fe/Co/Zn/Cd) transporter
MEFNSGLQSKALRLSYFTVGYNVLEGVVSLIAGAAAGSTALLGFGLDSFLESLSGGVMIWRFTAHDRMSEEQVETMEQRAIRLVGVTFLLLGAYVGYESVRKLALREAPEQSLFGIVIAVVSLIVMPVLYRIKYKTGKSIGSESLVADSKETLACSMLSVALLLGLGLHYLFGFWWADPAAGLLIVLFLLREGVMAVKGETCACDGA